MSDKNKILITGACGRLGTALLPALAQKYGHMQVIASDAIKPDGQDIQNVRYVQLNVLDKSDMHSLVIREKVTQVYHLAALLTAAGEKQPRQTWDLNMIGLQNVLDIAKCENIRMFWPSSVAVFGSNSPRAACPQFAVTEPATIYGISKLAGELWCKYYHDHYGVDVRSVRYPGLIGDRNVTTGGTLEFAVQLFHEAMARRQYTCYLKPHTTLPFMYMPDAVKAALHLMDAPSAAIKVWSAYNLSALSFSPQELEHAICRHLPAFRVHYKHDSRQQIAETWPASIDDRHARQDWGWMPAYDLQKMTQDMLHKLEKVNTQKI